MVVISVNLEECEGLVNWRTLAQIPDEPAKRRPERVDKDDGDEDEGESDDEPDEGRGGGGGAGIYQRIIAKWSSMNRKSTGGGEDGGGSESEGYTSDDYDLDDDGLIDNTELQVCTPSYNPLSSRCLTSCLPVVAGCLLAVVPTFSPLILQSSTDGVHVSSNPPPAAAPPSNKRLPPDRTSLRRR